MTAQEFMALVASQYTDEPDDYALSLGHWEQPEGFPVPRFYADIRLTMAEVRAMAATS